MTFHLAPRAPFAFEHTLAALATFPGAGPRRRVTREGLDLALRPSDVGDGAAVAGPTVARVRSIGTVDAPRLEVVVARTVDDDGRAAVAASLRRILALDLETAPLHEVEDPVFAPVLEALRGYHPPRFASIFEAAAWAVVRQRTPRAFAEASMERLARLLGEHLEAFGASFDLFPDASAVDDTSRPALLAATHNTRKVDRLVPLARRLEGIPVRWFDAARYAEARARLQGLPGLGPWSSEFVLLRGLGRYERTPWTDTGALPALSRLYTPGLTLAGGSARELAERYGWLQGLWLLYVKRYVFTLHAA